MVFYARRYFARESNKTSDMRFQAEKFNNDLQLLKNGGEYLYGDEDVTLEPAQGKYAEKIAEVEEMWERFYGNIRIIDTKKLMKENPNAGELFSDDAGLRVPNPEVIDALSQMENSTTEFDDLNKELLLLYTEGLNDEQDNFKLTLLFLGILNLIVVVVGYIIIVRNTVTPLKQIANVADLVSEGHLVKSTNRPSNDEIGILTHSINSLVDSLEEISSFATNIGKGNFSMDFKVRSNKDKLGLALLAMRNNLKKISEEDKKRNWANEGMAQFGELLRKSNEEIDELAYQVISNIVKYLKANQGGIFLLQGGHHHERYLELTAAYAYSKKKYVKKRVEIGQGLLGQCVLEEATIHLREIPQGYIDITSGLGESTPTSLLIVPLKVNDNVYGVLEIASFNKFKANEIEFVERLSETVASTLANVQSTQTTKSLLEDSQLYAEQLRAQEEEMRQNMEELAATQEEMGRVQVEMKNNEYNLNALINNTKDMIWAIDDKYHIMVFNKAFAEYQDKKGITVKKGMSIFDTLDESETNFWKKNYDRGLGGEQFLLVENFKTFTYEDEYQAISFNPIISPTDDVEGLSVFIKDVTAMNPIRLDESIETGEVKV
ncbi:MAG: GAF domain-containing protein/HAMP domain-containing protein [Arenicella sp.]